MVNAPTVGSALLALVVAHAAGGIVSTVVARRPGGRPAVKPAFRVLVHHKYLPVWNELADRVGLANAQQFWNHVAMTPGQPPKVGTTSIMKGRHNAPKWPGYSKTIHYEITGAGRIDYQFNTSAGDGARGDPHGATPTGWSRSCPSTSAVTDLARECPASGSVCT